MSKETTTPETCAAPSSVAILDEIHANVREIRGIASGLSRTSLSFEETGNEFMAMRLQDMSDRLTKCADALMSMQGRYVDERLKDAEQSTATMLSAVLAVAEASK